MAKAKSQEQYTQHWKNHVAEVLYGPVRDLDLLEHPELEQRLRESVTKLCTEIDEVSQILENEGVFFYK